MCDFLNDIGLANKYFKNFIETGTYLGETTERVASEFDTVYTIELSEEIYKSTKQRLSRLGNVKFLLGDSSKVVDVLSQVIDAPAVFFLDAHFAGGSTAQGEKEVPLYEELSAIAGRPQPDLIIIDDYRLFGKSGQCGAVGSEKYPPMTYDWRAITLDDCLDVLRHRGVKIEYKLHDDRVYILKHGAPGYIGGAEIPETLEALGIGIRAEKAALPPSGSPHLTDPGVIVLSPQLAFAADGFDFSSQWGAGLAVTQGPSRTFLLDLLFDAEERPYEMWIRYASGEPRPVDVLVNGNALWSGAAGEETGGWFERDQVWGLAGMYRLAAGRFRLSLSRNGWFPHISSIVLVPAAEDGTYIFGPIIESAMRGAIAFDLMARTAEGFAGAGRSDLASWLYRGWLDATLARLSTAADENRPRVVALAERFIAGGLKWSPRWAPLPTATDFSQWAAAMSPAGAAAWADFGERAVNAGDDHLAQLLFMRALVLNETQDRARAGLTAARKRFRGETASGPYRVFNIELTNKCPMKCVMCARTHDMTRDIGFIDGDLFRRVIDQMAADNPDHRTSIVWLHHFGESLTHPNFAEFINYAAAKGVCTGLSVNPIMLKGSTADDLLSSRLNTLYLSMDGHDDASFEAIRGVENAYGKSRDNLLAFLARKVVTGSNLKVVVQMINFSLNDASIAELASYWRGVPGVDEFTLKPFLTWNGDCDGPNSFVEDGKQPARLPFTRCQIPWTTFTITWDGDVVPCCYDYDKKFVLGNAKDTPLREIWNGPAIRRLRQEFNGETVCNALCKKCPDL